MTRILIVEDNSDLAIGLQNNLEIEGHAVVVAADGPAGLHAVTSSAFDLVVLDLMLPGMDGYRVLREMRARDLTTPVLLLTARSEEADKVRGLQLGADDYITKPFSVLELLARVSMVLRRAHGDRLPARQARFAQIVVDFDRQRVERNGVLVPLTQKEMELLRLLLSHPDHAVTRDELLRLVWGYIEAPLTRTVDTHVAELRRKLEHDAANPRHIITVRKTGYRLAR